MSNWKQFEKDCCEYLNKNYGKQNSEFKLFGKSDSTLSDICYLKDNKEQFFIEVKEAYAQSGQFVLLPDTENKKFIFSSKNKSQRNDLTNVIIEYMNNDFDNFNSAGTAGKNIKLDKSISENWIKNYYSNKNVKFFISKNKNYVIFPTENFGKYFDVSSKYRIKKSGSQKPAEKYIQRIVNFLKNEYNISNYYIQKGNFFVIYEKDDVSKKHFQFENGTYRFSPKGKNLYEIRKLSNTYNMNVIFSISLKSEQYKDDLDLFKKII